MRRETIQQERSSQTGFTLIELLVVIAIILVMASFAAPRVAHTWRIAPCVRILGL